MALIKTGVSIPAEASLQFKHPFDFEGDAGNYDGVLEYSVGNTVVLQDAQPLFAADHNYNGTIYNGSGNSLGGYFTFTKVSYRYVSSKYNLTTLAGKVVWFRFRQANNQSIGKLGCADDIQIYTCR